MKGISSVKRGTLNIVRQHMCSENVNTCGKLARMPKISHQEAKGMLRYTRNPASGLVRWCKYVFNRLSSDTADPAAGKSGSIGVDAKDEVVVRYAVVVLALVATWRGCEFLAARQFSSSECCHGEPCLRGVLFPSLKSLCQL